MKTGLGYCAPCHEAGMKGLGTIVMQPLHGGGLGQGREEITMQYGAAGPLALMAGAGLSYGAVSGLSARSWDTAGTGALLGAGMVGLAAGGTVSAGAGASAGDSTSYLAAGLPATLLGAGLLIWGGMRAWRG